MLSGEDYPNAFSALFGRSGSTGGPRGWPSLASDCYGSWLNILPGWKCQFVVGPPPSAAAALQAAARASSAECRLRHGGVEVPRGCARGWSRSPLRADPVFARVYHRPSLEQRPRPPYPTSPATDMRKRSRTKLRAVGRLLAQSMRAKQTGPRP